MSYYGFRPYVPVAKRRAKAERAMKTLKKTGRNITPITIEKLKIAHSVWGKAWCEHIESFSDYENRLPRGRTYVRNGSVCHLAIQEGTVEAIVSGSELYNVHININPLPKNKWNKIKIQCAGKIGSLLDLLGGKLSEGIMSLVCDRDEGLFPSSKEIKMSCDCPDWASMCKHIAAVLYGVGARLDDTPESLFQLRAVDHHTLIDTSDTLIDTTTGTQRRRLSQAAIADVFDIDITDDSTQKITTKKTSTKKRRPLPEWLSGAAIQKKRKQLSLSKRDFAALIGVTATTVTNWERQGRDTSTLRQPVKNALQKLWEKVK